MNTFGDLIAEDKKIANLLNYTFSHLGDYYGRKIPNNIESKTTLKLFSFRPTTIKEVFDAVKSLKINKPLGPSSIPAWDIKDGMTEIVPQLTMVINEYVKKQKFPSILKKGLITPLYKKDDPLNPLNYRPITITSSLSKKFEKLLHKQINQYLSSNKLLSPLQFGFREKISTQDALIYFTESIRKHVDENDTIYSVCIDLSKAFDSVSHQILLEKLNLIGFNDDALELIFSFLSHRSQQVVINNTVSYITETYQGVPQGTLLGPLLFNIYKNDITKYISEECRIIQYADDCLIYSANPKPDIAFENLRICLEKLENYFRSNQLTLNASKTEFIRFSTPKITVSNSQLIVAGSNVKLKNEVKYLGIIIDNKLSFEYQVKSVLKKMALGIRAIQTIRNNLPKKCLKVLLHALVLSHFEYCNLLSTDISSALLLSLEKQLNWALRTVFYRSRNKCSTSLRISEEILSMKQRIDLKSFDLLYSILKNERSAFQNHLKLPTMSFRINERNKKIILKEPGSSKFLHGFFFYTCVRSWNYLPTELRTIKYKREKWKKLIKEHMIQLYKDCPTFYKNHIWHCFQLLQ